MQNCFSLQIQNLIASLQWSSKQTQEQLLEVSRSHEEALSRLEEQERSHQVSIQKSKCLTALLEEDRGRSVHQTTHKHHFKRILYQQSEKNSMKINLHLFNPTPNPSEGKEIPIYSSCRKGAEIRALWLMCFTGKDSLSMCQSVMLSMAKWRCKMDFFFLTRQCNWPQYYT